MNFSRFHYGGSGLHTQMHNYTTIICVRTCTVTEHKANGVWNLHNMYVESYQDIWDIAFGEELVCKREPNMWDSYTVTVIKDDSVVEILRQYARIAIFEASHVKTSCD